MLRRQSEASQRLTSAAPEARRLEYKKASVALLPMHKKWGWFLRSEMKKNDKKLEMS